MKDYQNSNTSNWKYVLRMLLMIFIVLSFTMILIPGVFARDGILVIYSSNEKNKIAAQAVSDALDGTILEINDLKKRTGITGYFSTKFDGWFNRNTIIDPVHADLESFPLVVIVSSVKKWQMEISLRTFINKNRFEDTMLFVVTTSEMDIKRFDSYDDNASCLKRRAQNKVRKWRKKSWKVARKSGAKILGHVHISTKDKNDDEIQKTASNIFNYHSENAPEWLFKAEDLPTWMLTNAGFEVK